MNKQTIQAGEATMRIGRRGAERDCGELTTAAEFREFVVSPRRTIVKAIELSPCGTTANVLIAGFGGFGSETRRNYWLKLEFDASRLCGVQHALYELCARSAEFVVTQGISRARSKIPLGALTFRLNEVSTAFIAKSMPALHQSGSAKHKYTFALPSDELNRIRAAVVRELRAQNNRSRSMMDTSGGYIVSSRGYWTRTSSLCPIA